MTIAELIEKLSKCPKEYEVCFEDKFSELGLENIAICTETDEVEIRLNKN